MAERHFDRGTRRGEQSLRTTAEEFLTARLTLGLSQRVVSRAAQTSRSGYQRIERGLDRQLTVMDAARIGAVLGLNLSVRFYPAGPAVRDAGQAKLLNNLLSSVGPPLRHRTEVPLPRNDERPEYRAWDAVIWDRNERTTVELETRLYDIQAQVRAFRLKLRDDPPDHFLLALADTRTNRRVIADFPELLNDLPRLRTASVLAALRHGEHPKTGLVLL